jgi:hypothetical protein
MDEADAAARYRLDRRPTVLGNTGATMNPLLLEGSGVVHVATSNVMINTSLTMQCEPQRIVISSPRDSARDKNNERWPSATMNLYARNITQLGASSYAATLLVWQQMLEVMCVSATDGDRAAFAQLHHDPDKRINVVQTITRAFMFADKGVFADMADGVTAAQSHFPDRCSRAAADSDVCMSKTSAAFKSILTPLRHGFERSVHTMRAQLPMLLRSGGVPPGVRLDEWKCVLAFLEALRGLRRHGYVAMATTANADEHAVVAEVLAPACDIPSAVAARLAAAGDTMTDSDVFRIAVEYASVSHARAWPIVRRCRPLTGESAHAADNVYVMPDAAPCSGTTRGSSKRPRATENHRITVRWHELLRSCRRVRDVYTDFPDWW